MPEIASGATTVIEKGASGTLVVPSLTLMVMLAKVPTLAVVGVPDRVPLLGSKLAQAGMLLMENVSVLPAASVAVGVKL